MTELNQIALKIISKGKGILAADESNGTMTKRLEAVNLKSNPENIQYGLGVKVLCIVSIIANIVSKVNEYPPLTGSYVLGSFIISKIILEESIKYQNFSKFLLPNNFHYLHIPIH